MSESDQHISLKQIVSIELQNLGFQITVEPESPPSELVNWRNYRPDIVGVLSRSDRTHLAIVECETQPCRTQFAKKNWHGIRFQTRLFEEITVSFILAVPTGNISKVTTFRRLWEIWQINTTTKQVWKIPCCNTST